MKRKLVFVIIFYCSLCFAIADDLLPIRKSGKWGYINLKGEIIISPQYDFAGKFKNGFSVIGINNQYNVIDALGNLVFPTEYSEIRLLENNYIALKKDCYALANTNGKTLTPFQFSKIESGKFNSIFLHAKKDSSLLFNTASGIFQNEYTHSIKMIFNDNKCIELKKGQKIALLDTSHQVLIPWTEGEKAFLVKGVPILTTSAGYKIYDASGTALFNDKLFQSYNIVSSHYYILENSENKFGMMNAKGNTLLSFEYDYINKNEDLWKGYKNTEMDVYQFNTNDELEEKINYKNVKSVHINKAAAASLKFRTNMDAPALYNTLRKSKSGDYIITSANFRYAPNSKIKCKIKNNHLKISELVGVIDIKNKKIIAPKQYWDIQVDEFDRQDFARAILPGDRQVLIGKNKSVIYNLPVPKSISNKALPITYIGPFSDGLARVNVGGAFIEGHDIHDSGRYAFSSHNLSCEGGHWGYVNGKGEQAIAVQFDYASDFKNGKAIVCKNGKYGVINTSNEYIIQPHYDLISYLENSNCNYFKLTINKKEWGIINAEGKVVSKSIYDGVGPFSENRVPVKTGQLWGACDFNGTQMIAPQFKQLATFREGKAAYKTNYRWGYIDAFGKSIIAPKFIKAAPFHEGKAAVLTKNGWGFINEKGELIIKPHYKSVQSFDCEIAAVCKRKKWKLINENGKTISQQRFKKINTFNEHGIAIVKKKSHYRLLTTKGKLLPKVKYKMIYEFSEGLARVKTKNNNYGFINEKGKVVIPAIYDGAGDFSEGKAKVQNGKRLWAYINPQNIAVIEHDYKKCGNFSEGKTVVATKNQSLIIDSIGTIQKELPLSLFGVAYGDLIYTGRDLYTSDGLYLGGKIKSVSKIGSNAIRLEHSDWSKLLNTKGTTLAEYPFISTFENNRASFYTEKRIGLADSTGNIIVPTLYQNMSYAGNDLISITNFDAIGYLYKTGDWLWKPE